MSSCVGIRKEINDLIFEPALSKEGVPRGGAIDSLDFPINDKINLDLAVHVNMPTYTSEEEDRLTM